MVLAALPSRATIAGTRTAAGIATTSASAKWGDLIAEHLPDSALVPVSIVLAKQAIAQGAVMGSVKISSKAIPVIGAAAGAATSFYFGSSVVKSCRTGFSAPVDEWPEWLELVDEDGDGEPDPSKAVLAMRAASDSAKDFGESVWGRMVDATEMFRSVDIDGDGIPDAPRAVTAVRGAAASVGGVAAGTARAVGGAASGSAKAVGSVATGAGGAVAGLFRRGGKGSAAVDEQDSAAINAPADDEEPGQPILPNPS